SQLISQAGLHQIHLAETEKYNQVTFYFNGKNGQPFKNEEWVLIPSPQASDYADYPEMSAFEITSRAAREIRKKKYQFILINYCNPDIIGWSNNQAALKKSIEIVDQCLGQIIPEALDHDGTVLITADHGQPGTINPVPLILIGKDWEGKSAPGGDTIGKDLSLIKPAGGLADVAPTILKLLGIKKPAEMTGQPLI
ncbi:MAG TPA: 2,3-bisphosphoglycerate-independent phosphoglycerate mutase, partial [Patescibacteria group bacterium]